mmetsp:Transcript_60772/g.72173  ORF Transcript_60772/g.72173 Transcript_60772/m.72173 type:complete len:242 (+) Transcript_60772:498-1223(+)
MPGRDNPNSSPWGCAISSSYSGEITARDVVERRLESLRNPSAPQDNMAPGWEWTGVAWKTFPRCPVGKVAKGVTKPGKWAVVLKRCFHSFTGDVGLGESVGLKGARVDRPPLRGDVLPMAFLTSQNLMIRSSPEVNSWVGVSVEGIGWAEEEFELWEELMGEEGVLGEEDALRLSRHGQVSQEAVLMHPPCRMDGTSGTLGGGETDGALFSSLSRCLTLAINRTFNAAGDDADADADNDAE